MIPIWKKLTFIVLIEIFKAVNYIHVHAYQLHECTVQVYPKTDKKTLTPNLS